MTWKRKFGSDIYRRSIALDFNVQKDHCENLYLATCEIFELSVLPFLMLIDALPACPVPISTLHSDHTALKNIPSLQQHQYNSQKIKNPRCGSDGTILTGLQTNQRSYRMPQYAA
jgi:hypothetical protein